MAESLTDEITALNQLAYRYAHAIDTCDEVLLNQVFTPDGRMRVYHPGQEQPFTDLPVRASVSDQIEDFTLPRGQGAG